MLPFLSFPFLVLLITYIGRVQVVTGKSLWLWIEKVAIGADSTRTEQEEQLGGPGGEQGLLRRLHEDRHGGLPRLPGQGANAEALSGGRALEPAVCGPGAG